MLEDEEPTHGARKLADRVTPYGIVGRTMYKLHCFAQSGNAYKVAIALQALGQPWTPVHLPFADFASGLTKSDAWRQSENPLGEVPILDTGAERLTQSAAILLWLADKHDAYGGNDEAERREVLQWLFFDNHKFTSYFATYRFIKSFGPAAPDPAVMNFLAGRIDGAWSIVDKHLANRDWLVGHAATIADLSLCGYLFYPPEESGIEIAAKYPSMARWLERVKTLPGWKGPYDLMPGEKVAPRW
jgi:glutathione S-transferase